MVDYVWSLAPRISKKNSVNRDKVGWRNKLVSSDRFTLMMVPVSVIPPRDKGMNWKHTTHYYKQSESFDPIVLELEINPKYKKHRLIRTIDGKHRHMAASIRGDEWIQAYVGDRIPLDDTWTIALHDEDDSDSWDTEIGE